MGITVLSSATVLTTSAPADDVAAGPSVGVSTLAARGDHAHRTPPAVLQTLLTAAAPLDTAAAAAVGTALLAARGDHVHKIADSGWLAPTLQNSWVNYDPANYPSAGYRKLGPFVYFKGLIRSGTIGSVPAFTLPAGYIPVRETHLDTVSNGVIATVRVMKTGEVHITLGNNGWLSLDGCYFDPVAT